MRRPNSYRTATDILETLHLRGFSLNDLQSIIDPNFYNIIDTVEKEGGTLGDLLTIIYVNKLDRDLDMDHLEEKVENHYEL